MTFAIIAGLVLLGGIFYAAMGGKFNFGGTQQTTFPASDVNIDAVDVCGSVQCSSTKEYLPTLDVENALNSTTETYDTTLYFFNTDGSLKRSFTDTTNNGVSANGGLECGKAYDVAIKSTSGAAGDSGKILAGPKGVIVNDDGTAKFVACGTGDTLTFRSEQHGLPEVRAKNVVDDGFMHDNQDIGASATDYETLDGVQFYGTTNSTATAVGSGGELHVIQYVRANIEDENFNDLGIYILIDAPVAAWDIPTVKINGVAASEASSQLNNDERVAYSDYEYVYFVPSNVPVTRAKELAFDLSMFALAGTDPTASHNVSIDYAPIGRYSSNKETNVLKVGAVDDSSARADVHTRHDTLIIVS